MKHLFILFAVVVFSFFNTGITAQDEDSDDSVSARLQELGAPGSLGDTVLNRYQFETDDSMQVYKQDKDFAYMKYLDSLLRNTKGLTVDTFSIGNAAPSRNKSSARNSNRVNRAPVVNIFNDPVLKIILWIVAIFLLGFLIYKLFLGENIFRRSRGYKHISETPEAGDDISDPSKYDELIRQAVMNKNYRLAIRYSYLQTLYKLVAMGLLQFSADKTNYQYVRELRGKPYQNDFAAITLNYEYVWYGKFEIGEDVYHRLSKNFKSFHQNFKSN